MPAGAAQLVCQRSASNPSPPAIPEEGVTTRLTSAYGGNVSERISAVGRRARRSVADATRTLRRADRKMRARENGVTRGGWRAPPTGFLLLAVLAGTMILDQAHISTKMTGFDT